MKRIAPLLALILAGHAPASLADIDRPGTERIVAGVTKSDVWQAVMTALEDNDLPVVAADFERGEIRARQHGYLDPRFASCPNVDRRSFDPLSPANLGVRSSPLYRGVDLRLTVNETAKGTQLSLSPLYTDVDRDDGRREFAFQVTCRSTGVLEQVLFSAASES